MFIASISKFGISANYRCYNLKYTTGVFKKKCPDENTAKCYYCEYCKAELPARDATRLINSIGQKILNARGK